MVTAAVLSKDQRLTFLIHTWMKDLAETVKLETHQDFAAFVTKIETENVAELMAAAEKKKDEAILDAEDIGAGKSKIFEPFYRLLMVDLDLLQELNLDPVSWAKSFKKTLDERGRSDGLYPTKILFMAFEGGEFKIDEFRDPVVDDLIFKPLDRSVFLQKVEILTADDPAKLKPTFLFRQKVDLEIEIGKDAIIDEVSEFAVALRNPAMIKTGTYAGIHSTLFGDGDLSRVIGRAYYSEPHPHIEGQFLVSFGLFGLRSDQLLKLRKFVRDRQIPAKFRVPKPVVPSIDPAVPFSRVAVIDMDEDVFSEIQSALRDHYIGVETQHFLSNARFLATLIKSSRPADGSAQVSTESLENVITGKRPWTMAGSIQYTVGAQDHLLRNIDTPTSQNDLILGKSKQEWALRPQSWLADLSEHDREELDEMLTFTLSGGRGRALLHLIDAQKNGYHLEAVATLAKAAASDGSDLIRVELREMSAEELSKANSQKVIDEAVPLNPIDFRYDAIFIDANLVRGDDLQSWIDGVHEVFLKAGIFARGEKMPRILIMAHEKSVVRPEPYRLKGIADFLYKPLDRKMLSNKVKTVVDELIQRSDPDVPPFVTQKIDVKLAKDARMLEVSEYGLSIAHPTPFRHGTMIRFFSSQIGGGADGVIGRCSHCEKTTDKIPSYICYFTFFGVSDEILKKIRTWIREDYVQRKDVNS